MVKNKVFKLIIFFNAFILCFSTLQSRFFPVLPRFINSDSINNVILSGGGANLNNIREVASNYFKSNVRIGRPIGIINLPEIVQTPTFACLTGLLVKSLEKENTIDTYKTNVGLLKYFGKVGNWFDQNI